MIDEPENVALSRVRVYVHAHSVYRHAAKFHNIKWIDYHSLFRHMLASHLDEGGVSISQITMVSSNPKEVGKTERLRIYHNALTQTARQEYSVLGREPFPQNEGARHDSRQLYEFITDLDNDEIVKLYITSMALKDMCQNETVCVVSEDRGFWPLFMAANGMQLGRLLWLSPKGREVYEEKSYFKVNQRLFNVVPARNKLITGITRKMLLDNRLPEDVYGIKPPLHQGWSISGQEDDRTTAE